MRLSVDGAALDDPRFKRLGKALAVSWYEALGRCIAVWLVCYDRRAPCLEAEDVDIIAELEGFASALVSSGLAEAVGDDHLRMRGVTDRIEFLLRQVERGKASGVARRSPAHEPPLNARSTQPERALSDAGVESGTHPSVLALVPDSALDRGDRPGEIQIARQVRPRASGGLAQELATCAVETINGYAGTKHRADTATTTKDCQALAKAKVSLDDVRAVISAKWREWGRSDKMREHFRPSTLLRPSNFLRYRDETEGSGARSGSGPAGAQDSEQIVIGGQIYDTSTSRRPS